MLAPPIPTIMPALLERPKLSNAMARALHKHIMRERERKRQEEEEVDKMMEQKLKEEEERKRKKEMEERMSLEETKEQIMKMGVKLQGLQEEKHQLFLQLKKVLHEEEKRRRKEQSNSVHAWPDLPLGLSGLSQNSEIISRISNVHARSKRASRGYSLQLRPSRPQSNSINCDMTSLTSATYQSNMAIHSGQHLLSMQGQVSHGRPGALLGERSKQLFQSPVIPTRHFQSQPGFSAGGTEHGQYSGGQPSHSPYGVTQPQHASPFASSQPVPANYASGSQLRGASAFQAMQYLPHQQQGYAVHSHFTSQPGYIPSAGIPLQKQLEHANQQSGFTDSSPLRPMHPQALHVSAAGMLPTPSIAVQIPPGKSGLPYAHPPRPASPGAFTHGTSSQQAHAATFQSSSQPTPRHAYLSHSQSGQRFYHHGK
ncbi:G protein pathway suppressor 2-like isoform X2 [Sinocyclocheilus anshuiensis]|uniref:G protein pathway suppressor 2-like isoform X2 n=1 Tax=Sinocyclocheilus anshuiensis TaxID=1608454 RepID=UPI0007B79694|nr:PREDICTED: G protein pathway suppressor 2-like isoform X2 [Sinocyclocheilus anshuiensis]